MDEAVKLSKVTVTETQGESERAGFVNSDPLGPALGSRGSSLSLKWPLSPSALPTNGNATAEAKVHTSGSFALC